MNPLENLPSFLETYDGALLNPFLIDVIKEFETILRFLPQFGGTEYYHAIQALERLSLRMHDYAIEDAHFPTTQFRKVTYLLLEAERLIGSDHHYPIDRWRKNIGNRACCLLHPARELR